MFIVLQNPAIRIFEDYHRSYHANLTQYLDHASTEDNALIRSILCKAKGDISIDDFKKVDTYLKHHAIVLLANKHKNIVRLFHEMLRPNLDRQIVSKCMEDDYKMNWQAMYQKDEQPLIHLQQMHQSNFFDFSIYRSFISKK